ncbi:hypothetical protein [Ekhidna sp.]|uniref:hypothetical protein n=1 Tax=Ekhidna sp. TaxID=2608089 RepID=UPI003299829D
MKKKIVIASVLKPVDDVRAYWKLSQSMAKTNKYEVNIIGNSGKKQSAEENILFHTHTIKRSNWIKRALIRGSILIKILKIRPKLLIISTHELIMIALIGKIFTGCKLIYDVQENYSRNLAHINSSIFRKSLATIVRCKENISKLFIDQYWLAESCYLDELPFSRKNYLVVENKALFFEFKQRDHQPMKMLFSGTISEYGGVRKAIDLFKKIQGIEADSTLTIIGQIHDQKLRKWLTGLQQEYPTLELNIATKAIPYEEILKSITQANLGVIGYKPALANKNKIPTKLYEYSRYQLPYVVQENTTWSGVGINLGGAIPIELSNPDVNHIFKKLNNPAQLFPNSYPNEATWEAESIKVISSLESLIN